MGGDPLWYRPGLRGEPRVHAGPGPSRPPGEVRMRRALSVQVALLLLVLVAPPPVQAGGKDAAWSASRSFVLALLNGRNSVEPGVSSLSMTQAREWLNREVPGESPIVSFR